MKSKVCPKCKINKPYSEYYSNIKRKDGISSYCKECRRKYGKKHYNSNKSQYFSKNYKFRLKIDTFINRYKSYCGCKICGEKRYWVLDLHHIDEQKKDFSVGGYKQVCSSLNKVKNEIRKCIVVCANCHRDIHFKEKNGS